MFGGLPILINQNIVMLIENFQKLYYYGMGGDYMNCPICGKSDVVIKYGKDKSKRQLYRCKECEKIFYDEKDYIKPKGKSDIRVRLLGIILKYSDFDLFELNKFLGLTGNSSEISLWENNLIRPDLSDLRMPYMKSHSHAHHSLGIESKKENITKYIEKGTAKKGIYIALNDDCSISYIDVFDET